MAALSRKRSWVSRGRPSRTIVAPISPSLLLPMLPIPPILPASGSWVRSRRPPRLSTCSAVPADEFGLQDAGFSVLVGADSSTSASSLMSRI